MAGIMAITRPLNPSEVQALLSVLPSLPLRDHVLLLATLRTGFRVSEILQTRLGDVWQDGRVRPTLTIERRLLKFGRSERRRTVRSRTVPIGPALAMVLGRYIPTLLTAGATEACPLFRSRKRGLPLQRCHANRILHDAFTRAGVAPGGWGMHALRKSFAVAVHAQTKDLNQTRLAMGHSSILVTQRYLESTSPATETAILALG